VRYLEERPVFAPGRMQSHLERPMNRLSKLESQPNAATFRLDTPTDCPRSYYEISKALNGLLADTYALT